MNRLVWVLAVSAAGLGFGQTSIAPGSLKKIGSIDPRFLSYNVEMVEVTGGRFWAPYRSAKEAAASAPANKLATPGIDPSLFRQRTPIDLGDGRLRKLAAALGPAYVRVSGTWANSTYFHDSDAPAPTVPPEGFGGVLTKAQWRGVMEFSKAVDAKIVTSFAISAGVRDAGGTWTPREAAKVFAFTKAEGGSIAAAEMFNEPSFPSMGGAPKGYDAAQYGRDFVAFRAFVKKTAPEMLILGPGSVGEGTRMGGGLLVMKSEDMLTAAGPGVDGFSYHYYGGVSQRCSGMSSAVKMSPEGALTEGWLAKTDQEAAFYRGLRDRFEPGTPLWLTETGETACGGNPWASTFTDTFRFTDQMGRLARQGVQVIAHNTLAASDYALIDEETMTPRPSYWSAVLWRRLMGSTVLDAGVGAGGVHVYAHCLAGRAGGVALLAINTDGSARAIEVAGESERFALTARELGSKEAMLWSGVAGGGGWVIAYVEG